MHKGHQDFPYKQCGEYVNNNWVDLCLWENWIETECSIYSIEWCGWMKKWISEGNEKFHDVVSIACFKVLGRILAATSRR